MTETPENKISSIKVPIKIIHYKEPFLFRVQSWALYYLSTLAIILHQRENLISHLNAIPLSTHEREFSLAIKSIIRVLTALYYYLDRACIPQKCSRRSQIVLEYDIRNNTNIYTTQHKGLELLTVQIIQIKQDKSFLYIVLPYIVELYFALVIQLYQTLEHSLMQAKLKTYTRQ